MQHRALFIALAVTAWIASGCASTPDESVSPPETVLPAFPTTENLLPFAVSATSENSFLVDTASIDVVPDRDVQLTLVVRSPGGAETVTREAIHCQTAEYRILAIGRRDDTWKRLDNPPWRRIEEGGLNRHRAALALEYVCEGPASVVDAASALAALRDRRHLKHGIDKAP
ncbi:MAG: CNP1-like family protein [Rhodocyclaceae bacterium]|nr:CNP1-like family protein [Rhodocyclaceae bacterium]